ncbi:hypothetical protein KKG24_01775 [Patescibacteria group bacterium]|nr:hypothetical protein [Patescibacteria group bacterium]
MKSSFVFRSRIVLLFVVTFAVVLIAKLFFVQLVHGNTYSQAADRQYSTPSANIYERGTIYFERKDGTLLSAATKFLVLSWRLIPKKLLTRKIPIKNYLKLQLLTTMIL